MIKILDTGKYVSATNSANLFPTPVNGIYTCTEEIVITTENDINVTISDILLIPFDVENLASKKGKIFLLLSLSKLNMRKVNKFLFFSGRL